MNLSIRARILLGIALPIALFIGFTAWLSVQLTDMQQSLTQVSEQSVQYALRAADMDKNVVQIQQFLSDVSATRGKDGLDDGFEKARENYDALMASLTRFEKRFKDSGDAKALKLMEALKAEAADYFEKGQAMAKAYVSGGPDSGNKLMAGFDGASENLQKDLRPFVQSQVDQMKADLQASTDKSSSIKQSALGIVMAAVAVALLGAWLVTSSITRPLAKALGVAQLVASGRLETPIEADASEIGQLLAPLGKM